MFYLNDIEANNPLFWYDATCQGSMMLTFQNQKAANEFIAIGYLAGLTLLTRAEVLEFNPMEEFLNKEKIDATNKRPNKKGRRYEMYDISV